MSNTLKNPIGFLQELCQKHRTDKRLNYHEMGATGPDHRRMFSCKCVYDGLEVIGVAPQKKQAKVEAAKLMIELLQQNNDCNYNPGQYEDSNDDSEIYEEFISLSKNPISLLLEYCQGSGLERPTFLQSSASPNGFACECCLLDHKTYGYGTTKKAAKIEAAYKMCIELNVFIPIEKDSQIEEGEKVPIEKNIIYSLQVLCCQCRKLTPPVYEEKRFDRGLFVIVCTVGSMSAEGKGSTRSGAKLLAAKKVFEIILASNIVKLRFPPYETEGLHQTNATPANPLQEYNLGSDEESNYSEDEKSLPSMSKQLDTLSLDDSGYGDHLVVNEKLQPEDVNSECSKDLNNEMSHLKTVDQVLDQLKQAQKLLSETISEIEKAKILTRVEQERPTDGAREGNSKPRMLVRALYNYDAESGDELSLKKGDLIEVLEEGHGGGWCKGRIGTHVGLYPFNFVQPVS